VERRALVPVEVAAVLAIAIAWPLVDSALPVYLPLLAVASVSRWLRKRSWLDVLHGGLERAAIGAGAGAVALGAAIVIGTPVVEALSNRAVEWSQYGFVRGSTSQLIVVIVYVAIAAIAAELALRGWIVERVLELSPGPPVLPILAGAIAEAAVMPGGLAARAGAAVFGIGLGWIYVAGGRSVVAPLCARVVFAVGALLLEGFRVLG
jgi:hypothetical protein